MGVEGIPLNAKNNVTVATGSKNTKNISLQSLIKLVREDPTKYAEAIPTI